MDLNDLFGQITEGPLLEVPKARALSSYLGRASEAPATIRELRVKDGRKRRETVLVDVHPELPQDREISVKNTEAFAITFEESDTRYPEVRSLRTDFPRTIHVNPSDESSLATLCIYFEPWSEIKLTWSPQSIILRICDWLVRAAEGNLHFEDQPLEPLIQESGAALILPADFASKSESNGAIIQLEGINQDGRSITFRPKLTNDSTNSRHQPAVVTVHECDPQTHRHMHACPTNLEELDKIASAAGCNVLDDLTNRVIQKDIVLWQDSENSTILIIVVIFPLLREEENSVEKKELWGFRLEETPEKLAETLGLAAKTPDGAYGRVIGENSNLREKLSNVSLLPIKIHESLTPDRAAELSRNGHTCSDSMVAIGVGALGSQIFDNLSRSGFGRWTIIDSDILLPHNLIRHTGTNHGVGFSKAYLSASIAADLFWSNSFASTIFADILRPDSDNTRERIDESLGVSRLVLDTSASVAVARFLSRDVSLKGKAVSAFLNPRGDTLIILAENSSRTIRLDSLEMQYYREVISNELLTSHLTSSTDKLRYSNACRDLTSAVPQDNFAVFSGVASGRVKGLSSEDDAHIELYTLSESDFTVSVHRVETAKVIEKEVGGWKFLYDNNTRSKLWELRRRRLPNETGGVLVGCWDTERKLCYIVDALPSPPDSIEWPTSYIRGCTGLGDDIDAISRLTLGAVGYVGEWHSHPNGVSCRPSKLDLDAHKLNGEIMKEDSKPPVMMIVAETEVAFVGE